MVNKNVEFDYNNIIFKEAVAFAETIATRYYSYYKNIFQLEAIELDDLLQDARLATIKVYQTWMKNPRKFNLKGGVSVAVGFNEMNKQRKAIVNRHLLDDLTEELKKVAVNALSQISSEDRDLIISDFLKAHPSPKEKKDPLHNLYDFEEQKEMSYKNIFEKLYGDGTTQTSSDDFEHLIEDIRECTKDLRKRKTVAKVFKYFFEEGLTLEQTGRKMNCSKQRVWDLVQEIKKAVNEKIDINQYSKYN